MRPDTSALRTDPIYLRALMLCSFVLAITHWRDDACIGEFHVLETVLARY